MKWENEEDKQHFDWEAFRKGFSSEEVWKQALHNGNTGKLPWVEKYVEQLVSQVLPAETLDSQHKSSKLSSSTYNIFETHQLLIARIQISQQINPDSIRIFVGTNKIKVQGLTHEEDEEKTILLPKTVKMDRGSAVLKDNVVEVRLAKQTEEPFSEITIRHL